MIFPTEVILKAINLSVLKKKMAFSTPPSSSSSFLIQYQRDYDSIHHNKRNGAKKQLWKGKLLSCLPIVLRADFLDQMNSVRSARMLNTFLNHIWGELVLRQCKNFATNCIDDHSFVLLNTKKKNNKKVQSDKNKLS